MRHEVSKTERGTIRLSWITDVTKRSDWVEFSMEDALGVAMNIIGLVEYHDVDVWYEEE